VGLRFWREVPYGSLKLCPTPKYQFLVSKLTTRKLSTTDLSCTCSRSCNCIYANRNQLRCDHCTYQFVGLVFLTAGIFPITYLLSSYIRREQVPSVPRRRNHLAKFLRQTIRSAKLCPRQRISLFLFHLG